MHDQKEEFIPYQRPQYTEEEVVQRAKAFYQYMDQRRSVREYSDRDVPREVIDHVIRTASCAPSGAHKQPWTFCVIRNADLKHKIRELAEEEERKNYGGRMSDRWIKDLEVFGTDDVKEFIDIAPWIIVVMKKSFDFDENGKKVNNYYVNESVGIASGFLITAIHNAGLVTLTHTPSPMNFIAQALERPENEKPFLLLPVGYPHETCTVPNLKRKDLSEIAIYYS